MNTAAVRDNWVGRVIDGRFTLLQWLGGSEPSPVFLTELQGQGPQKAAIKLVPTDSTGAQARVSRWQAATSLSHPHLLRIFQAGRCQIHGAPLLYVVTEYSEEDLSQILPERALTPAETNEMLRPVLDALSYLHGKGLVHGHVKPSNIMVVDNQVKLSADGLGATGDAGNRWSVRTVYDAPEVATAPLSPAADVWSLGVTLVDALTQAPPGWEVLDRREPVLPESMPEPFRSIARECLRLDPARRCTLGSIQARLEPATSPVLAAKTGKPASPKPRVMFLIAAVLALLVVFGIVKLSSHSRRGPQLTDKPQTASTIAPPVRSPSKPEPQAQKDGISKGAIAGQVLPDVPRAAGKTIQGRVKVNVRVTVDPSGNVSEAKLDSTGPSKYFANLALQAARHWKFKPAQVGGQAASSVWVLRFQFRQTATDVTAVEAGP